MEFIVFELFHDICNAGVLLVTRMPAALVVSTITTSFAITNGIIFTIAVVRPRAVSQFLRETRYIWETNHNPCIVQLCFGPRYPGGPFEASLFQN